MKYISNFDSFLNEHINVNDDVELDNLVNEDKSAADAVDSVKNNEEFMKPAKDKADFDSKIKFLQDFKKEHSGVDDTEEWTDFLSEFFDINIKWADKSKGTPNNG